ncbi:MAG TPA: alpha-amylase family glycosyl hydrolase, partial [Anaerolineales bacterium]|nr:alpha-amylase family glycosyl hydrolase [Anaerolineales bacterium]
HPEGNGYWARRVAAAQTGDEYKYVIVNGDQTLERNDPYARALTNSIGNSIVFDPAEFDWEGDEFEMPAWNSLVIYELHVGTFNVTADGKPGDFAGLIAKLPYLKDLGINAIEIMPAMEFPGDFSWGYNMSYPFAIEHSYGGPRGFMEFIKAAHQHRIAVILDVVYNHLGPNDIDLWRFDGWYENERGGIYFYQDERAETPWGATRPDYGRPEVRQYLRDNAVMWLGDYHVDGLRIDGSAFIRNVQGTEGNPADDLAEGWQLLEWLNAEVDKRFPWKIMIAEDLKNNESIVTPRDQGGAGFDAQWDAVFVHPLRTVLTALKDSDRDREVVRRALEHNYRQDAFRRIIYTESHDEVANGKARLPEEISPGNVTSWFAKKRAALGGALTLTAPGVPMLFQGQEFLEDRWFDDRDPLHWQRTEEFAGLVNLYRNLIRLRRNQDGLSAGLVGQYLHVFHLNNRDKVLAFHRWADDGGPRNSVVVVANFADKSLENYRIGFPQGGLWKVRFNSDSDHYDAGFGNFAAYDVDAGEPGYDGVPASGKIAIGPYTVLIYSKDA